MNSKTVLIADVSDELRQTLTDAINAEESLHVLATTASGRELVRLTQLHQPDLIVMDMILAELDGVEVLSALPGLEKRPSVLILSTFTSSRLAEFVSAHGANYFLSKPCPAAAVAQRASQMLLPARSLSSFPAVQPMEVAVTALLHETGVPAHMNGYHYLRSAILAAWEDKSLLSAVTKSLYPAVARQHDTTASRVERSMRSAIETGWDRADPEDLHRLFGSTLSADRCKPTISEFISMILERLRLEQRHGSMARWAC